jgi:hypothetical protein
MARARCGVCGGLGRVPMAFTGVMMYSGPNGESVPYETCQNCQGERWVGVPDIAFTPPTPEAR